MTSAMRKAIRETLLRSGFTRASYSRDEGNGVYTELWARPGGYDTINISWGPRDA